VNGKPRFIVHGVTAEAWSKRWGVSIFEHPCTSCGRPRRTTIPFAQGTLRGLMAPPCACGNIKGPFGLVRDARYGDLFTGSEEPPRRR
jgi:hypothetical protein